MNYYKISESTNYRERTKIKRRTARICDVPIRVILVDGQWRYCLQDILSVAAPPKNCGHHVAEWLRRCPWLDVSVYVIDTQAHYADWNDCCKLAEDYMYVYRQSLSTHGRVRYMENGEYEKGSCPCKNKFSESPNYKLWRSLLEKATAINTLPTHAALPLSTVADFTQIADPSTRTAKRPKFVKASKVEEPKSVTIPVLDKASVMSVTEEEYRKENRKNPEDFKKPEDPVVNITNSEKVVLESAKSAMTLIAALLAGKKLKIEISLEG